MVRIAPLSVSVSPTEIEDPLTAVLRRGARRLLAQAIEAEAEAFLATMKDLRLPDGRGARRAARPWARSGRSRPGSARSRCGGSSCATAAPAGGEQVRFTSAILPRWARRTRSLDALLPILYLRGVSMGDFQEALGALLGKDAPNLSPSVIARLRDEWEADYARWQRRDLSARRYVYVWADGVYLQARMEPQAECMLVLIGATPEGKKELVGFQVGVRESAQSWRELLVDLKARGLAVAPELAIGDGALGFWKALEEVLPIDPAPALLRSQDRQRAQQAAEIAASRFSPLRARRCTPASVLASSATTCTAPGSTVAGMRRRLPKWSAGRCG